MIIMDPHMTTKSLPQLSSFLIGKEWGYASAERNDETIVLIYVPEF